MVPTYIADFKQNFMSLKIHVYTKRKIASKE